MFGSVWGMDSPACFFPAIVWGMSGMSNGIEGCGIEGIAFADYLSLRSSFDVVFKTMNAPLVRLLRRQTHQA